MKIEILIADNLKAIEAKVNNCTIKNIIDIDIVRDFRYRMSFSSSDTAVPNGYYAVIKYEESKTNDN